MTNEYKNRRAIRNETQKHLALALAQTAFGRGIFGRTQGATQAQLRASAKLMLQGKDRIKVPDATVL